MAFSRVWQLIVQFTAALALRFIVAVAYATGFNAVVFLPLAQVRAQTLPSASTSNQQGSAAADGLAKAIASPAAAAGGTRLSDALENIHRQNRLAQATRTAAAAKAPASASEAAASASTSDYAPAGGVDLGHVDPGTGKLTFSGPIASLGGATTPPFSLTAAYSSTQVYETAINWNYEQVPAEVGLGFSLPSAHLRIARLASSTGVAWNDSYMLMTSGSDYRLELIGEDSTNKVRYYSTNDENFLRVEYHYDLGSDDPAQNSYWLVTDSSGNKSYYGWAYRSGEGKTENASTAFKTFCGQLEDAPSFNNYDGTDVNADHCEFGPVEVDVRWGAWTGASMNTVNQEQFATSWYLSAMEGLNGKRTSLFYGRHTQDVGVQDSSNSNRIADALSFTKASYLYHAVTDDGDELVLNWGGRSNTEILDPRTGDEVEPDGYQEKYQILYLSSVNKDVGGTYSSASGFGVDPTPLMQVDLDYNSEVLLGFDDTAQLMGKRILTEITPSYYNFYKSEVNGGQAIYDPQPSYSFSYWGQSKTQQTADTSTLENNDGVSVSRWNDTNGFNPDNGGLCGLLKTVTSPEGLTATFRYSNAQGTGVQRSLLISNNDLNLTNYRHAYVGPGYMLVSGAIDNNRNMFYIYAWTSQGWKQVVAQESREGGFTRDFTLDPDTNKSNNMSNWVAAGNGIVGVLMPSNGDKDTNATCFDAYVFTQDRGRETWSAIGSNSTDSPFFGNYCGNVRLDVSSNVVTVVSGEEQKYHLWYSNNNWQDADGITAYSGTLSHTESGKGLVVGTQIGDGFAAFYIAGTGTAANNKPNGEQTVYADFLFIDEVGVQEASTGTAEVVSKSIQLNQAILYNLNYETWLILGVQNFYSQGSGINVSIPMHVIGKGNVFGNDIQYDTSLVLNHVLRGTFTNGEGAPLPADQSPIDYARANNGTAANYISLEVVPTSAQDQETASTDADSEYYFSDFVSTGMMAGVMNWTAILSHGQTFVQSLVCGLSVPTPTGLGSWNSYSTKVSDTGNGDDCFYGEEGDFSASEFYSSDDVFAVSRDKGGGYVSWVYDPLSDSIERFDHATMVYYPPRVHSSMQSLGWKIFDDTMLVVGSLMLLSGWGSALGAALTGEFLTATTEGVLSEAFTVQMTEPSYAHERITGGPLSYFGASRRIFYFGENFWVRYPNDTLNQVQTKTSNADEFEAAGISDLTMVTKPAGLISNYLPLTYYTNSEKTAAATYLFEFRNGDVRRDNTNEFAPLMPSQVVPNDDIVSTYWTSELSEETKGVSADVDYLTGDATFILYDAVANNGALGNFNDIPDKAYLEFGLFAVVDHQAQGEVLDKVVSSVEVDDGTKRTVVSYDYQEDTTAKTARYSQNGMTGFYPVTKATLEGTQETLFVAGTDSTSGCLSSKPGIVNFTGIGTDSTCEGGSSSEIYARWLQHDDGRIESLAQPGQCMWANYPNYGSSDDFKSQLQLAACNPADALQKFALLSAGSSMFYIKGIGVTDSETPDTVFCAGLGTKGKWTDCTETASLLQVKIANVDNSSRTAGYTLYYNYADAGGSNARQVLSVPQAQALLDYQGPIDNDFSSTRTSVPWTNYFSYLLGSTCRTESYRDGATTPYAVSDTMHEIVDLTPNGISDGELTWRDVRSAWTTTIKDGVSKTEAYEYNLLGQLRATHSTTQKLVTSADSSGTVTTAAQPLKTSSYSYYGWEVSDYRSRFLAENRLSDVYLSYKTVSDNNAAPQVSGAAIQTYTEVQNTNGTSVMVPQASYTARGNSIDILPTVAIAYYQLTFSGSLYKPAANWGCLQAANNAASLNNDCGDMSDPADSALYIAHKIMSTTAVDTNNYPVSWMFESKASPGYCLKKTTSAPYFALSSCNLSDSGQIFGLDTTNTQKIGYNTRITSYDSGETSYLYGFFDNHTQQGGSYEGWQTGSASSDGTEINPVMVIPYPLVQLAQPPGYQGASADQCLTVNDDYSLSFNASCSGEQTSFIARGDGNLESLSAPGYCLMAQTSGNVELTANNLCANDDIDAAFRLVFNHNEVNDDEALSYVSLRSMGVTVDNLCFSSYADEEEPMAWSDCDSSSATPLKTVSSSASIIPSPSSLDSASDQWIKTNAVLAWDDTLTQPLQQATYFGVSSKNVLMGITKSTLISKDGRGLTIAQFGGADTSKYEAGYFGLETYESSVGTTDSAYCTNANWSCSGGEVANAEALSGTAYAPHAGSSYVYYSANESISVTPANFARANDIYGNVLDYVVSAWVAPANGETCTLSMQDESGNSIFSTGSASGNASTWYYLEAILPASSSIGTNKPIVACSNGGAIDDIRYSTAVGGFAAAIYDLSTYYRPQAQLLDDGKVGRSAYDDRNAVVASYVERLNSTDHSVASRMLSNYTVAGYSRFNGFGQLNSYTDSNTANEFDIYSSSEPNGGATVTFAPEASLFCEQVPALSSDNACPVVNGGEDDYTIAVTGSSFVLHALVTPKVSASKGASSAGSQTPITLSWTPPSGSGGAAKLTFEYATNSSVNGTFNLYSASDMDRAVATSQTMAVPREWMIVAYEDNAFVFGDGKLVLSASAKSSDPWSVENYLFTTATTTITLDTDGADFTNLGAGSAPVLGMSYMNGAGQPIQRHVLNLMRSAAAEEQQGSLVDVADAKLFDGWGGPAVQTLSMYYTADTSAGDVEMLAYRSTFLPVFDWTNGKIDDDAASDLYAFYATGAGADRVQFTQDPYYALAYGSRYQEPAGRDNQGAGVGYPLSLAASQSRVTTTDYQDWNDANLSSAVNITNDLQSDFNTSSSYGGFGANLTTYRQSVEDVNGLSGVNRQAWTASSAAGKKNKTSSVKSTASSGEVLSSGTFYLNTEVPSTLTPSPGVSGTLARYMQSLLPNYFAGSTVSGTSSFVKNDAYVDVLGQWQFSYDPNSTGAKHAFADDAGRLRLMRANPDLTDTTSQGFHYMKRDAWGRVIEIGVLVGVANTSLNTYADWARQADFDQQLTAENSCALKTVVYDVDPASGQLQAYSNRRGLASKEVYYTTAVVDLPTSCPGRDASSPSNQTWYAYDDLGRETANTEYRIADAQTYRTTAYTWPMGLITQWIYPDTDQSQAFTTTGQSSMTLWPDLFGRAMRVCDGGDCSGTVYLDQTAFDWMGGLLASKLGNGLAQSVTYDFAGDELSRSLKQGDTEVFGETVLRMQLPSGGAAPCGGSADSPNYAGGFIFAHELTGSGLPSEDQNSWTCFTYDGAGRLVESDVYTASGEDWSGKVSYGYSYDPNGNLTGIETGVPSSGSQGASLQPKPGASLASSVMPLEILKTGVDDAGSSFTRSGSDQLTGAALASGTSFGLAYDSGNTYGDVSQISSGNAGFALALTRDAHTRQVTAQTITNNSTGETVLTASMAYDPMGRRTSRLVTAVDEGSGSSLTEYWYGKALVPLVVERDGKTYRMIGGLVIEQRVNGEAGTQYYPHRDYTSSVRVVTDDTGEVVASLGYDGDWGSARIAGQDYVSSDDGMEAFYRFQSQEAEIFPLSTLNISDSALDSWLDELQLHHFPYREYSAGLAIFLSQDPARQSISPYAAFGANPANIGDPTGAIISWLAARSWARDGLFTAVWGAFSGTLYAIFRPSYQDSEDAYLIDAAILIGGRYAAHLAINYVSTRIIPIGDGNRVTIRGGVRLRMVPEPSGGDAFRNVTTQEFFEGVVGGVFGYFGTLALGETGAVFMSFGAMAVVDYIWAYRHDGDPNFVLAYRVSSEQNFPRLSFLREFIFRGLSDTIFYGATVLLWNTYVGPGRGGDWAVGQLWFARNAAFRIFEHVFWENARPYGSAPFASPRDSRSG